MSGRKAHAPKPTCGAATRRCQRCGKHRKEHAADGGCTFKAKPCERTDLGAGGRCRAHGGKSPTGLASPNYKHGRWSSYLPADSLGGKFGEAYRDRTLMQLRQDAALVDALITSFTANLRDTGRPLTPKQEERLLALLDQRRKIVESEARRLRDLAQVVPLEQFRNALAIVGKLIAEHLGDNLAARVHLQATMRRLLVGKGPVVEAEAVQDGSE